MGKNQPDPGAESCLEVLEFLLVLGKTDVELARAVHVQNSHLGAVICRDCETYSNEEIRYVRRCVTDPWHFCTDPDPWIGSVHLIYGSGSGSCFFRLWLPRCQPKISLLLLFVLYLLGTGTFLFVGTFTSVFNVKKSLEVTKKQKSRFLPIFLLVDGRIWIRKKSLRIRIWTPEGPKSYGSGSGTLVSSVADPWYFGVDPEPDPRIHASD
jgi:hypothetical protein